VEDKRRRKVCENVIKYGTNKENENGCSGRVKVCRYDFQPLIIAVNKLLNMEERTAAKAAKLEFLALKTRTYNSFSSFN
jgi:hypothetical protein